MTVKNVTASEKDDLLKEQIADVLSAHRQLGKHNEALDARLQEATKLQTALDDIAIPDKADDSKVSACVEALESAALRLADVRQDEDELRRQYNEALDVIAERNAVLLQGIKTLGPSLDDDILLEAATSLAERTETLLEDRFDVDPKSTEGMIDAAALDKLRHSGSRLVKLFAQAKELQPTMDALASQIEHWHVDRNCTPHEPVRAIEEEVQRFLSELQDRLDQRFQAEWQAQETLRKRKDLGLQLESELKSANGLRRDLPFASLENRAHAVILERFNETDMLRVRLSFSSFAYDVAASPLDQSGSTSVGRQEQKDIDKLRKLMREAAFAIGAANEALTTRDSMSYISRRRPINQFPVPVPSAQITWEDCLNWVAADERAEQDSEQKALSLKTKKELVEQALTEARETRKKCMARLKQCNAEIFSRSSQIRCNELRLTMNAAALMHSLYSSRNVKPAFPILWNKK